MDLHLQLNMQLNNLFSSAIVKFVCLEKHLQRKKTFQFPLKMI